MIEATVTARRAGAPTAIPPSTCEDAVGRVRATRVGQRGDTVGGIVDVVVLLTGRPELAGPWTARPDGATCLVEFSYGQGNIRSTAQWRYDPRTGTVEPANDTARGAMGR
jgi:hypothetical protein